MKTLNKILMTIALIFCLMSNADVYTVFLDHPECSVSNDITLKQFNEFSINSYGANNVKIIQVPEAQHVEGLLVTMGVDLVVTANIII